MMREAAGAGWRLRLGDALRLVADLDDLEGFGADMVATDPPYSSGGMFRGDRAMPTNAKYVGTNVKIRDARPDFEGDSRDQRAYLAWSQLWMQAARAATRPGGILATFCDWRQLPITTDAVQAAGWIERGILAWDKTSGVRPQLGRFRQQAEFVVWASNGPISFEGRVVDGVFRFPRDEESREHATGKPVAVMQWLLSLLDQPSLVLDPFAGSGSTGIAALRLGHRFEGIEIAPNIFETAASRLAAETGPVARDGRQMQLLPRPSEDLPSG